MFMLLMFVCFLDMTPLLPIINGVGGNVVAVQVRVLDATRQRTHSVQCSYRSTYISVHIVYKYAQASRLATQLHVLHGKAGSKSRPNPNDDILARRGGCPLPNPFVTFFSHRTSAYPRALTHLQYCLQVQFA